MRNGIHDRRVMVTGTALERVISAFFFPTLYKIQLTVTSNRVPAAKENRDL